MTARVVLSCDARATLRCSGFTTAHTGDPAEARTSAARHAGWTHDAQRGDRCPACSTLLAVAR